jgi:PAS domain S-box-containing protein
MFGTTPGIRLTRECSSGEYGGTPKGTCLATSRPTHLVGARSVRSSGTQEWLRRLGVLYDRPDGEELLAQLSHLRERLARAEHFRSLLEQGPDALTLLDITGSASNILDAHIIGWNAAAERLYGYTAPEIIGQPLSVLIPLERTAEMGQIMSRLRRGERVEHHETVRVRKDGSRIDASVSLAPITDAAGQVVGVSALDRELFTSKQSDATLRRNEDRFRQLVESIPQMVWGNLADGTVEYLNRPCYEYFGVPPERMFGWDWRQAIHPDDLPRTLAATDHAMTTGEPLQVEYRLRRKDGHYRWHIGRAVALRDGDGRIARWFGAAIDIDEQKRAEEALRASEARNRAIADALPDLLFRQDASGKCLDYHAPQPEQLYASPQLFLGRRMEEVLPAGLARLVRENIHQTLASRTMQVFEYELDIPGMGRQCFEARMAPSGEGEVVSIVRNVTDRRRLEEQLRQSQKLEAVGRLAGGIAHDFNNLLTVINGYGDVLLATLDEHDPSRHMVGEIHKAGQRAAALTSQLLAFGRKQMIQPRVLDLNAVVADLQTMLARLIGEDVELVTALATGLARIKADASQVEQVIVNLAVNARDAMPRGGQLTIATGNANLGGADAGGPSEVRPGPYVVLSVSDTGIGMDEATRSHVFEPFFTTKEVGQGTGLGLATVYGIVKQSGGEVEVASEVGRGTTFRVFLPALAEAAPDVPATQGPADPPGGREVVLVVEDEGEVREFTRCLLGRLGYRVLAAGGGAEALRVAEEHTGPIDLLVTDVVMPQMSGRQVAEALRRRRPGLRVLYVSGHTNDARVRHGVEEAEVAFLQKPFSEADLAAKVRQVLDEGR